MKPGAWAAFDDAELSIIADGLWVGDCEIGLLSNDGAEPLTRPLIAELEYRGLDHDARALREALEPAPPRQPTPEPPRGEDGRKLPGVYVHFNP